MVIISFMAGLLVYLLRNTFVIHFWPLCSVVSLLHFRRTKRHLVEADSALLSEVIRAQHYERWYSVLSKLVVKTTK